MPVPYRTYPVAYMEDKTLPNCVFSGEFVRGVNSGGDQEKDRMGCPLDDIGALGTHTNQWTIAVEDNNEWYHWLQ